MGLPVDIVVGQPHICRAELQIHCRIDVNSDPINTRSLRPALYPGLKSGV